MARARTWAVVTTVGVLMGMGCADDPSGEPGVGAGGPAAIAAAVQATRAVPSARVELETAYRGLEGAAPGAPGRSARLVQRAAFDRRSRRAEAEMDMSELAALLDGADEAVAGDYSRPTRVVVAGDTVYSQIGPIAAEVGLDPDTWVTRDLASLADRPVENDTMALLVQPFGMLDLLRLPIESVRVVGEGDVRGEPAVHLEATVGLGGGADVAGSAGSADLAGDAGDAGGPPFEETIDARLRRLGLTELPVDLWLDEDRLVRRVAFSIDRPGAAGAGAGGLTTTFDIYEVGEPIDIDVPGGPDVIDQAELQARVLSR